MWCDYLSVPQQVNDRLYRARIFNCVADKNMNLIIHPYLNLIQFLASKIYYHCLSSVCVKPNRLRRKPKLSMITYHHFVIRTSKNVQSTPLSCEFGVHKCMTSWSHSITIHHKTYTRCSWSRSVELYFFCSGSSILIIQGECLGSEVSNLSISPVPVKKYAWY